MRHSIEWWRKELDYINSVQPTRPGAPFNRDRAVFARYCEMQARASEVDFPLIAQDIRQARDIADPAFRSKQEQEK